MPRGTPDRRAQILDAVNEHDYVSVVELARQFDMSEVSIRRNLEQLEQIGSVRRVHGGAQPVPRSGQPQLYDARLLRFAAEKAAIGRVAARLVQPGSIILLDSGTTVIEVARALPRELLNSGGLTVVTRSLIVAGYLRRFRSTRLIVLGGIYQHDNDDFFGPEVEAALDHLHVHTAFIGADGIDTSQGVTTDNVRDAGLLRRIAHTCEQLVCVTDSSKIGGVRLQTVLPLSALHTLVTDTAAPAPSIETFRSEGMRVILATAQSSQPQEA